ncbi:MAG: CRISPR-associated endonuclease Cas1 [Desulfococcaceae bacterium]
MDTDDKSRTDHGRDRDIPLIPARMLNEFVYCPRLAYMMWVQGEFAHNAYTVEGKIQHRRVDKKTGHLPPAGEDHDKIHARSVDLSSATIGVTARLDLVEGEDDHVSPVDYKRGKRPHVAGGAYQCHSGVLYFIASKERVRVAFDDQLVSGTRQAITDLRTAAAAGEIPPPLEDSPKCPKCSLAGICLPDELQFLSTAAASPRPIFASLEKGLPLYVQSNRAYIRKDGERFVIQENRETVAEARIGDTSQVALFGLAMLTTPALHECFRREIPVTYLSYGGWFMGHTVGTGARNVETRTHQYRASFDPAVCLKLARGWVRAKIANCRTLLRRNFRGEGAEEAVSPDLMGALRSDMGRAGRAENLEMLLGVEGAAANRFFQCFPKMLRTDTGWGDAFDFNGRNRRPPKDPVNALLSFAYSMLVREWTVALSAVGLDPFRGFYHQPRFGRPALALDMMEPFRPLIGDSVVLTVVNNGEIRPGDFIRTPGSCALVDTGRKKFIAAFERRMGQEITHPIFGYRISYRRLLEVQARLLVRFLAGEIPRYPNFVTR